MNSKKKVIVIGAGAGGMMAAGRAAELGADVLLLEKTDRVGKKILITGNGRCNLSNGCDLANFVLQYGANGRFLYGVFDRFFREELIAFFNHFGVQTVSEPNGKIYPMSQNAREIVRVFESYLKGNKVKLQLNTGVNKILIKGGVITGVQTAKGVMNADVVILATGGLSHPQTGSTGDGYQMVAALGHTIVKLRPGLVPMVVAESDLVKMMMGVSLHHVRITSFQSRADEIDMTLEPQQDIGRGISGKKPIPPVIESRFGDAIVTHFGLSGPIVLEMSLAMIDALELGPVSVNIDLKPEFTRGQLNKLLQNQFEIHGKRNCQTIMRSFLPLKIIEPLIIITGVSSYKLGNQIKTLERERITEFMKSLRFNVSGAYSMATAMITAGGISLDEINPETMESKIVKGLFFCGEVMDLDAGSGGYNLQAAFSTGYVAGENAAEYVFK